MVNAYGGKQPYVTVVEDRGEVVLVCKPQEFEDALAENREPVSVGFPKKDVILPKGALSQAAPVNAKSRAGD